MEQFHHTSWPFSLQSTRETGITTYPWSSCLAAPQCRNLWHVRCPSSCWEESCVHLHASSVWSTTRCSTPSCCCDWAVWGINVMGLGTDATGGRLLTSFYTAHTAGEMGPPWRPEPMGTKAITGPPLKLTVPSSRSNRQPVSTLFLGEVGLCCPGCDGVTSPYLVQLVREGGGEEPLLVQSFLSPMPAFPPPLGSRL